MASRTRLFIGPFVEAGFVAPGASSDASSRGSAPSMLWQPRLDVYESPDALLVQIEAPGLSLDQIELHFEPGQLLVSGVRTRPQIAVGARAAMVEMNYGPFRRSVPLPLDADGSAIEASYDAGILSVRVPRHQHTDARRIEIGAGN